MYIQYENKTYSIYKQVYRSERETGQPGAMSYILTVTAKKHRVGQGQYILLFASATMCLLCSKICNECSAL